MEHHILELNKDKVRVELISMEGYNLENRQEVKANIRILELIIEVSLVKDQNQMYQIIQIKIKLIITIKICSILHRILNLY